jgi:predicted AAA+ superfamily ATPase
MLERLLIYRGISADPLCRMMEYLSAASSDEAEARYPACFAALSALPSDHGDPWAHYLRREVLTEETAFTRAAGAGRDLSEGLREAMAHDLEILEDLHALDPAEILKPVRGTLPSWRDLATGSDVDGIEKFLATGMSWPSLVNLLWEHFATHSPGPVGEQSSFYWRERTLVPVLDPDPTTLADLPGYELERESLVQNARILASGNRANNVLVFGPNGTGKSSTVRALANEFRDDGLRLVQLAKEQMGDFPELMRVLRRHPEKFIVFMDDLAFELGEHEHGLLKGLLEGGIEARPRNVAIYSTSNRRHIVDERHNDRESERFDPIHVSDAHQHKTSLASRFGLRVLFPPSDQERYLAIVHALAERRGLTIDAETLDESAVRWSRNGSGLSPRTAQQFIDDLAGRTDIDKSGAGPQS